MRLVVLESPLRGNNSGPSHRPYAKRCVRDSLSRGEAPMAGHLLYAQYGILDDSKQADRALGIGAHLSWIRIAEALVVYTDEGVSAGMEAGIEMAKHYNVPIEYRKFYG